MSSVSGFVRCHECSIRSTATSMGIGNVPLGLSSATVGFPALTELGKRLELLRIRRALSKQLLARRVGISRQQLWRVMTGKSELTASLCGRLADALDVSPAELAA